MNSNITLIQVLHYFVPLLLWIIALFILFSTIRPYEIIKYSSKRKWIISILYGLIIFVLPLVYINIMIYIYWWYLIMAIFIGCILLIRLYYFFIQREYSKASKKIHENKIDFVLKLQRITSVMQGKDYSDFYQKGYE
jgi:hypothetical protein